MVTFEFTSKMMRKYLPAPPRDSLIRSGRLRPAAEVLYLMRSAPRKSVSSRKLEAVRAKSRTCAAEAALLERALRAPQLLRSSGRERRERLPPVGPNSRGLR